MTHQAVVTGPGHPDPIAVIVVPCYNEAHRLDVEAFLGYASTRRDISFLFVDDGSRDGTGDVLASLCRRLPDRLRSLTLERNCGKAEAVRRGVLAALESHPPLVGFWDADLATPLDAIDSLLAAVTGEPGRIEIAMGSRVRLLGRHIARNPVRHYVGRVFATAASLVLGIAVYDTQCGAKLFRATHNTAALFAEPFRSRWIFDVELIARRLEGFTPAERARADELIVEVPLQRWVDVAGSKVRLGDALLAAWELTRIYVRYRLQPRRTLIDAASPGLPRS